MGKIIINFVGSQASKIEIADFDCSSQILMFWRFIDFCDYSPIIFFHQGMGIILI